VGPGRARPRKGRSRWRNQGSLGRVKSPHDRPGRPPGRRREQGVEPVAHLVVVAVHEVAVPDAGVSRRTIVRWLADDGFRAEYRRRARALSAEAASAIMAAQGEAVAVLRRMLHEGSPATRVRAARALLEVGARIADDDQADRIAALEAAVDAGTIWRAA